MKKVYIITGTNKGLGLALTEAILNRQDTVVISISRKINEEQKQLKHFHFFNSNFDDDQLVEQLCQLKEIIDAKNHLVFINNAATVSPITRIGDFKQTEVVDLVKINIMAPVIISDFLLKNFTSQSIDFVNISSGAASRAIENWSLYCSSKAFTKMFFNTLELENSNMRVFNIDPGVLDTDMQSTIRANDFPENSKFRNFKENNALKSAGEAAIEILNKIQ